MDMRFGGLARADVRGFRAGRDTSEMGNSGVSRGAAEAPGISAVATTTGAPNSPSMVDTQGAPIAGILAILVVIFLMRFFANKAGESNEYSALMPTFYNIMLITLASVLGVTLMKFIVVRFLAEGNAFRRLILAV